MGGTFTDIKLAERRALVARPTPDHYDKREIMDVTARNMQAGNDAATGGAGSPLLLG